MVQQQGENSVEKPGRQAMLEVSRNMDQMPWITLTRTFPGYQLRHQGSDNLE